LFHRVSEPTGAAGDSEHRVKDSRRRPQLVNDEVIVQGRRSGIVKMCVTGTGQHE